MGSRKGSGVADGVRSRMGSADGVWGPRMGSGLALFLQEYVKDLTPFPAFPVKT